jgi:transcriptional regulator with XRE-family HTH domain
LELSKAFGRVLRRLRIQAGISQEKLGFDAQLERNFISLLELGGRQPSLNSVFKLSTALGIHPSKFMQLICDEIGHESDAANHTVDFLDPEKSN